MSTVVRTEESPSRGAASVKDESRLERLGYEQELKRSFSMLETFGVAFRCGLLLQRPPDRALADLKNDMIFRPQHYVSLTPRPLSWFE
jgi:hypothetical protein